MNKAEIRKLLYKVIEHVLCLDLLDSLPVPNQSFDTYMDSLDQVEFVMAVEEEFALEIPDFDAERINNIDQAVEYIDKHLNGSSEKSEELIDDFLTSRQKEAIKALIDERDYQESVWCELSLPKQHLNTPSHWLIYIQRYLNKAIMDENNQGDFCTMDNIRKIGAMCMAAMEQNEIVERQSD
ncbi:MAG: hypothetical protein CL489_08585 [Acidobacteria bacterium]|nr:hypothetical protein [Acidobacteriota bacterium]|tara:strand:- start:39376 stop:39921 length:546 start_codon:yes stop_codon:yes gene_type:complete